MSYPPKKTARPERMTIVLEGEANTRIRNLSEATGISHTRMVNALLSHVTISDVPAPLHKYGGQYTAPASYPHPPTPDEGITSLSIRSSRVPEDLLLKAFEASEWAHDGDVTAYLSDVMSLYIQADPAELGTQVDKYYQHNHTTYCAPSAFKTVLVNVPTAVVVSWAGTHMPDVELIRALIYEGL